jgi:hypothetical protein
MGVSKMHARRYARRRNWLAAESSALPATVNDDEPGRRRGGYGEGRLNDDQRVSNATTRTGFRCFDR